MPTVSSIPPIIPPGNVAGVLSVQHVAIRMVDVHCFRYRARGYVARTACLLRATASNIFACNHD